VRKKEGQGKRRAGRPTEKPAEKLAEKLAEKPVKNLPKTKTMHLKL
jgi:hypothetical protein